MSGLFKALFFFCFAVNGSVSYAYVFLPQLTSRCKPDFIARNFSNKSQLRIPKGNSNRSINTKSRSKMSLSMCICINCKFVTNCAAYHFVEERHSQPHMTNDPTFTPRDGSPTIHVNIRSEYEKNSDESKKEIKKMWREYKEEERAALEKLSTGSEENNEAVGPTTYNLSSIGEVSYEYDVVKCEDFIEEIDCWIKNMPQEVRRTNIDFKIIFTFKNVFFVHVIAKSYIFISTCIVTTSRHCILLICYERFEKPTHILSQLKKYL